MENGKMISRKKKPRQRNRPKNKANSIKIEARSSETSGIEQNIAQSPALTEMKILPKVAGSTNQSDIKVLSPMDENLAFMNSLQKEMDKLKGDMGNAVDFPSTLFGNLEKLINQDPISDVETSDDEDEYVEYIYNPRKYFLVSLCNFCKCDLKNVEMIPCRRCKMTYYCKPEHMESDEDHRQICYGLRQVADNNYGHIFHKCQDFNSDQFRTYRILAIRKTEDIINRKLSAAEQEIILFPRICSRANCREYRFKKLNDCSQCGQVAFCSNNPEHLSEGHQFWCKSYSLFKEMIIFQEKFGRLDPSLPSKVLREMPKYCITTKDIFKKLSFDISDSLEFAALSQISTGPLTAWYALKLCGQLHHKEMTIHLIGAEIEFEVDVLHKWELFFTHIVPSVKCLDVVFVGPELNPRNISFDQLKKTKCCRTCRKNDRTVNYHFENQLYHDYLKAETFIKPNLICFFNPGLYRPQGYQNEDTWPETIRGALEANCPLAITSYTQFEAPLDFSRILQECTRNFNVILPPTLNPFSSNKPERSFIHDEMVPLMFKNYYFFVIE